MADEVDYDYGPRPRNWKDNALVALGVAIVAAVVAMRPQALWYPRNELDLILAFLFGTSVAWLGFEGIVESARRRSLSSEAPRTLREVALTWALRFSVGVLVVGATIAVASRSSAVNRAECLFLCAKRPVDPEKSGLHFHYFQMCRQVESEMLQ